MVGYTISHSLNRVNEFPETGKQTCISAIADRIARYFRTQYVVMFRIKYHFLNVRIADGPTLIQASVLAKQQVKELIFKGLPHITGRWTFVVNYLHSFFTEQIELILITG